MGERLFDLEPAAGPKATASGGTAKDAASEHEDASARLGRVVLLVAYDGSTFHGFAPQRGLATVGGALLAALSRVSGVPELTITCAGRTDAGVHASGQVAHVDLPAPVLERLVERSSGHEDDLAALCRSLTSQIGPMVAVLRAMIAPAGFDARRSALARLYHYDLLRTTAPDPLLHHTTWHVPGPLDLAAMRIACDALLGEHDFAAFCKRPTGHEGPILRRVTATSWLLSGEASPTWRFAIEANAFCHQMVRSIVGALVAVGQGRLTAASMLDLLQAGRRSTVSQPAPPGGLRLVSVRYPEQLVPGGVITAAPGSA